MKIGVPFAIGALVALATAGQALATPRLWVVTGSNHVRGVAPLSVTTSEDETTGRTTVFVPSGYRVVGGLNQRITATVGTATVEVKESDGSSKTLTGSVTGATPQSYANSTCATDEAQHDAVWVARVADSAGSRSISIPVFVDHVVGGPDAKFGGYKLQFCTASPAVSANVRRVELKLTNVFVNPIARGWYIWRARFDPVGSDGKTPDVTESTSARAVVPLNVQLTMTPKRVPAKRWVVFTGKLTAAQLAVGAVPVRVYVGRSARLRLTHPRATVRTKGDGTFRVTLRLGAGRWYARAVATSAARDITSSGCADGIAGQPVAGAKGCVSASLTAFTTQSRVYGLRF